MKTETNERRAVRALVCAVAGILFLVPFHAFLTSWAANNFGHLDAFRIWKEIVLVLISPIAFWVAWRDKNIRFFLKSSMFIRLFVFYVFLHLALGAWALHQHEVTKTALVYSLIINLRFFGFFIIAYVAAAYSVWLRENAVKILMLPAVTVVTIGLLQKITLSHNLLGYFYGPGTIPPYQTVDGNGGLKRVQSTMRGANPLGAYLILAIPAFVAFLRGWLIRTICLLAALIVLFYSYSRSAWIGVIISLWLLAWWMLLKSHHRVWLVSSVIALVFLGSGSFYFLRSKPIAQDTLLHTSSVSKSPMSSNQVRLASLKSGLQDVVHQPFGRGPGTAGPASFRNKPHPTRIAENYYLQLGQEVGVIGMLLFIAMNVVVVRDLWFKRGEILAKVLLASFAGITFVNLISHAWTDDTLAYVWWGLAGIALAPALISRTHKPAAKRS
ncbi:MAG: hypothetical protein JWO96_121 [Candidatus Saccharibacteria bacterium]|nr:hypothetical protein [Candidatus Saccharibacteria bacterium]